MTEFLFLGELPGSGIVVHYIGRDFGCNNIDIYWQRQEVMKRGKSTFGVYLTFLNLFFVQGKKLQI